MTPGYSGHLRVILEFLCPFKPLLLPLKQNLFKNCLTLSFTIHWHLIYVLKIFLALGTGLYEAMVGRVMAGKVGKYLHLTGAGAAHSAPVSWMGRS